MRTHNALSSVECQECDYIIEESFEDFSDPSSKSTTVIMKVVSDDEDVKIKDLSEK